MDELTDIYKRIEYLRNNGVKMKEIADRVDMAPSVLSALYSSVLPAYIDLLKTRTPDEALDEALALVNNVSKKRLLNNVVENILFENIVLNGKKVTALDELNVNKKDFVNGLRIK